MPLSSQELAKQIQAIISSEEIYGDNAFVVFVKSIDDSRIEGVFIDALTNSVYKFSILTGVFEFHSYLEQKEDEDSSLYARRLDAFNAGFSFVANQLNTPKVLSISSSTTKRNLFKSQKINITEIKSAETRHQLRTLFN